MLAYDEIVVFVVDEDGRQLDKRGPVQWSGELREGQIIPLTHEGRVSSFRVRSVRPGEGQGRFVQVIEVVLECPFCHGRLRNDKGQLDLEQDAKGAWTLCRHCGKRVALEPLPTLPNGPLAFRVAPEQQE